MGQNKFSISKRLKSFVYAFNGLSILLKEEHNSRIHFITAILTIVFGFVFKINQTEWLIVLLCIGWVISMELINSAIENLADFVSPERQILIKKTKDLAAGAVLWSAMIAAIIGGIIFFPKLMKLF